jgi:hypothetical protein
MQTSGTPQVRVAPGQEAEVVANAQPERAETPPVLSGSSDQPGVIGPFV